MDKSINCEDGEARLGAAATWTGVIVGRINPIPTLLEVVVEDDDPVLGWVGIDIMLLGICTFMVG